MPLFSAPPLFVRRNPSKVIRFQAVVRLGELAVVLPPETKRVTPDERASQRAARAAAYAKRRSE
jgi:hypothetical protein